MPTDLRSVRLLALPWMLACSALAACAGRTLAPPPAAEQRTAADHRVDGAIRQHLIERVGHPGATAPDHREEDEWLSVVLRRVRETEYIFHELEPGVWTAPNRAQHLRTRISSAGAELFSRDHGPAAARADWTVSLGTTRFGRTGASRRVPRASLEGTPREIRLERGALVEWFRNDVRGIEHGWTIVGAPNGEGDVWIGLAFEGTSAVEIAADAGSAVLHDADGMPRLRYHELHAEDASGRSLSIRIEWGADGPGLRIDDAGARYPLVVDPLVSKYPWTLDGEQAFARLESVATAGDVNGDGFSDVLLGAPRFDVGGADVGRVFLFYGKPLGPDSTPGWVVSGDQPGALLGHVATAGDVNGDGYDDVLIAAPLYDAGELNEGAVFLWSGSGLGLVPNTTPATADWRAESNQTGGALGTSTTAGDFDGDGRYDVVAAYPGAKAVLLWSGVQLGTSATPGSVDWSHRGTGLELRCSTAGDVDGNGFDDLVVGSVDPGQVGPSKVQLFLGSSQGLALDPVWEEQRATVFGADVSLAGDVDGDGYGDLLVGELDLQSTPRTATAYLLLGRDSGVPEQAWFFERPDDAGQIRIDVTTAGDVNGDGYADVLVGFGGEDGSLPDRGAAFLFPGGTGGLSAFPRWSAEGEHADALYGSRVATGGDVDGDGFSDLLVGSPGFSASFPSEGRVELVRGGPHEIDPSKSWGYDGMVPGARLGAAVASAGDVNGDGFGDVVVGAPQYEHGGYHEGAIFVFHGGADGPSQSPWTFIPNQKQPDGEFGYAVACAGDVDDDGYDDVVVGAPGLAPGGWFWVFHGGPNGLEGGSTFFTQDAQVGSRLGHAVASAGDVNGDGAADVVVGAPLEDGAVFADVGRAGVWLSGGSGTLANPSREWFGSQFGEQLGFSVGSAGDVDADGYADVLVGSPFYDALDPRQGRVQLFPGSAAGVQATSAWSSSIVGDVGHQSEMELGWSVAGAGDVDGNGLSDFLVGFPGWRGYTTLPPGAGGYTLWFSSPSGPSNNQWTISTVLDERLGHSVAAAGDLNADGRGDVVAAAPLHEVLAPDGGRAFVRYAVRSGSTAATGLGGKSHVYYGGPHEMLGFAVAGAGDVNGDGFADVVLGVPGRAHGGSGAGGIQIHYGNGDGGRARRVRQSRVSGEPLAVGGSVAAADGFRIDVLGFSPAGRETIRLQYELRPQDTPFYGTGDRSSPADTGPPGADGSVVEFHQTVFGLAAHTVYRWRARFVSKNPYFPRSPWFWPQRNSLTEIKFRTD